MNDDALQSAVWRLAGVAITLGIVVLFVGVALGVGLSGVTSPLDRGTSATADDPQHVNPAELEPEFDLASLERQLGVGIAGEAERIAATLDAEDYERARERLGDERYQSLIAEYRDIAEDVGEEQRAALFERALTAQQNVVENATAYTAQYERYEIFTGDRPLGESMHLRSVTVDEVDQPLFAQEAPRMAARDLESHFRALNESAAVAIENYRELTEIGDGEYGPHADAIANVRDDIAATQQTVREEQFVPTNLTLSRDSADISPERPLETQGRLTADETPVANETITLAVGTQRVAVTTNETGWFDLAYWPTRISPETETLSVRYRPAVTSAHQDDTYILNVTIEQSEPVVSVDVDPETVGFGENVSVTGALASPGGNLTGLPYTALVGGVVLGQDNTTAGGEFDGEFPLPADVSQGQQELTVRFALGEMALASTTDETTLDVVERETTLAFDAEPGGDGTILVQGEFALVDGTPIPGQPLRIAVDGTPVDTIPTDEEGTFVRQVVVPESVDHNASASVTATFDGTGTNLESADATAETDVRFDQSTLISLQQARLVVGVVAGFGLVGLVVWTWSRRRGRPVPARREEPTPPSVSSDGDEASIPLEHATELLEAGDHDAAIRVGYGALRHKLADDSTRRQTHWEFYRTCRRRLDDEREATLRHVTECYERVAFAAESADPDLAREVLDAIQEFDEQRPTSPGAD